MSRSCSENARGTVSSARRTIASRGPFLRLSIAPGSVLTAPATLEVEAFAPSWIVVDRLLLLRDGVEVARADGTTATFELAPDADAAYVVIAEGDRPMLPVSGNTPWALASPILVDLDGDGWDAPLPPLSLAP